MSAVITLLEQSTCQAGRKSNQTSCRKVGTFRNQTAGYADCDDETACYVDGNVAKVAGTEEVLFCHTNKENHQQDQNNDTVIDQYIFYIQLFLIHSLFLL